MWKICLVAWINDYYNFEITNSKYSISSALHFMSIVGFAMIFYYTDYLNLPYIFRKIWLLSTPKSNAMHNVYCFYT